MRRVLLKLVPFLFLFWAEHSLFAQSVISGRVFGKDSGEPLAGVNIIIKNTPYGAATDANGFFKLEAAEKFPWTLQFSMLGFKKKNLQVEKSQSGVEVFLAEQSILNDEIVVRAEEREVEQKTFRTVVTMEMMDALAIRESPSASFYEAIGNLKGVDMVKQSLQFITVNARGFNSTENKRLVQVVDGMDNMAPGMNFPIGNIAGLSELDVERVEFIPGPAEVQYGGNALNGVLIMKSKDPFKYEGVGFYFNPGISDIVPGSDYPFQFSVKPQMESSVRIAKAWKDKFAVKLNGTFFSGEDWFADDTTNIRPGNIKWEHDPGHDAINKYGDEVVNDLPIGPGGSSVIVSRTGYLDQDLVDSEVKNIKLSGAVHYRLTPEITAILAGNYGNATTVYTGDNRISLSGFKILQGKAEINGKHFMLRGYSSLQNSGESYDAKFLAVHLNEMAKSDEDWFHEYSNAYRGKYPQWGIRPGDYQLAREFADRNRLIPGTPEFEEAKEAIIHNPDFRQGAGIYNHSSLHHVEGVFDLNRFTGETEIELGGHYRFYDLDSKGSIFPDTVGNDITFYELGGFAEAGRKFMDEKLELKAAARWDKSENFPVRFSPRFFAFFNLNEDNNVRISILQGYRNPGIKEQFINKDLGTARYLGGLGPIKDPYELPGNSIHLSNINAFHEAVKADMQNGESTWGLNQAMINNLGLLEEGVVRQEDIGSFEAEKVFSFEIGYKTKIRNFLFLDASYYNSRYRDFIGIMKMVKPRTSPQTDLFTAAGQVNKSAQNEVFFLNANSREPVGIHGLAMGYKWLTPLGSILSGNITLSEVRSDTSDPVAPGFNTPGIKTNLTLQNRRMDRMENNPGFRNIGFKVTWRYQNAYYWESAFGDGMIPRISTIDLQFSVNVGKPKSLVKFGASNFFNDKFAYSFGGPHVGVVFYASYVIDDIFGMQ